MTRSKKVSNGTASSISAPVPPPPAGVQVFLQPRSLNLIDAAKYAGVSQWTLSEAIMTGKLSARWAGRSRIVLVKDLNDWLDSLDTVEPSTAKSILARKAAAA